MTLIQSFNEGGIFMYFILILGLFTMALIVERAIVLFHRTKNPPEHFRRKLAEFLSRGDLKGAEAFAMTEGAGTPLGRIAEVGCQLRRQAGGDEEVQARMDEMLSAEISAVDQRSGFLAMSGNIATLLGLLGTISGMIHSFAAVANASPVDRATMLSKGISEAMNCTAFGLIVAIPALVAYAIFQNRTDKIVTKLTETTSQIYHDLLFFVDGGERAGRTRTTPSGITVSTPTMSV